MFNMEEQSLIKNYDMNIWDETAWKTGGVKNGGWRINFYTIPQIGSQYGSGEMLPKYDFILTFEEAEQLGLTDSDNVDTDFFTDIEAFVEDYENIPERLLKHFDSLPEYEQNLQPWEPIV